MTEEQPDFRPNASSSSSRNRQIALAFAFAVLFQLADAATAFAQKSAAAPAFYLPVGLAIALVLWGGPRYWTLVFACELIGALLNYHRSLFSWCGIPGVIAVYMFYAAGLYVVRRWWPVDVKLSTAGDVGRMTLIFLISAVPTAVVGTLTLLGDGVIERAAFTKTAINWWESDAISILTFTPHVAVVCRAVCELLDALWNQYKKTVRRRFSQTT
jgi:integral membrane sensor domain MASE1